MVITPTGPQPDHTHGGPVRLLVRNYQIAIFDPSQSIALALGDSLRTYLDGYKGEYGGVDFGAIYFRLQTNSYEPDTKLFEVLTEFRIWFRMPALIATTRQHQRQDNAAVTTKGQGNAYQSHE